MDEGMAERWWEAWVSPVVPYVVLLRWFVDGRIPAEEFEIVFLQLYADDDTDWPEDIFRALDDFFFDVDDFTPNPRILAEDGGLDEEQLRARAVVTLDRLGELARR